MSDPTPPAPGRARVATIEVARTTPAAAARALAALYHAAPFPDDLTVGIVDRQGARTALLHGVMPDDRDPCLIVSVPGAPVGYLHLADGVTRVDLLAPIATARPLASRRKATSPPKATRTTPLATRRPDAHPRA